MGAMIFPFFFAEWRYAVAYIGCTWAQEDDEETDSIRGCRIHQEQRKFPNFFLEIATDKNHGGCWYSSRLASNIMARGFLHTKAIE